MEAMLGNHLKCKDIYSGVTSATEAMIPWNPLREFCIAVWDSFNGTRQVDAVWYGIRVGYLVTHSRIGAWGTNPVPSSRYILLRYL